MSESAPPTVPELVALAIYDRAEALTRRTRRDLVRAMLEQYVEGDLRADAIAEWTSAQPEPRATPKGVDATPAVPDCDHDAVLALWAEVLPELVQPMRWTPTRQALLRAQWREIYRLRTRHGRPCVRDDLLALFRRVFVDVSESPFLMGRVPGRDGRPPFRCTLDWLLRPANFAKLLEGVYERRA